MRKIFKIILIIAIFSLVLLEISNYKSNKPTSIKPQTILNESGNSPIQEDLTPTENESSLMKTEKNNEAQPENTAAEIPEKHLLQIPFYSQAPLSKWDAFHEDMCEEASVLNAGLYLENKKLTKDQFEAELQRIQKIEKDEVGEWKSTTVAQTKKWADAYFEEKIQSKIINDPTAKNIEAEIAAGNPVVAPLAGRDIGNPNFTPPGPIYHMLVIKGYDTQNFITNDVGTRKGESYLYKKEVIMKNIHDWNEKDIHAGASRILVLSK